MKLLLSWIADHLVHPLPHSCISKITEHIAEVDDVLHFKTDHKTIAAGVVQVVKENSLIELFVPECNEVYSLPYRSDVVVGSVLLISLKEPQAPYYLSYKDVGGTRELMLPPVSIARSAIDDGSWKKEVSWHDTLITIDNGSIGKRPDLWSHRGYARELALITENILRPDEEVYEFDLATPSHAIESAKPLAAPEVTIATEKARTFAAVTLAVPHVPYLSPERTIRLARLNVKLYNALIDLTNYVLFDIGQPLHAFDASAIADNHLIVRDAYARERLLCLDGEERKLSEADIVVSDGQRVHSFAGIIGGMQSSVKPGTITVMLEAANFVADAIRSSALRHGVRTDSAIRFEKNVSPAMVLRGLKRYFTLLGEYVPCNTSVATVVDMTSERHTVECSHLFIQQKLGIALNSEQVLHILHGLGMDVLAEILEGDILYKITPPYFRALDDLTIPEDIVDEIGRIRGFNSIIPVMPLREMSFQEKNPIIDAERKIKEICVLESGYQEVLNYSFYDSYFVKDLNLQGYEGVPLRNPISQQRTTLVGSLIPNLFQAYISNSHEYQQLRFVEVGRGWSYNEIPQQVLEKRLCAGIAVQTGATFFSYKAELQALFSRLQKAVVWQKPDQVPVFFDKYKTAVLGVIDAHGEYRTIGYAGFADADYWSPVYSGVMPFLFEIDIEALVAAPLCQYSYQEISKYPAVKLDVSVFAEYAVSVKEIEDLILQSNSHITTVQLKDVFEKEEWGMQRSLTFRYISQSHHKTLDTQDLHTIQQSVENALRGRGLSIR